MKLVVDSSVWIDYFNGKDTAETGWLDRVLGAEEIVVGDLILTEVLQGFRRERDFRRARALLQKFEIVPMLGREVQLGAHGNGPRIQRGRALGGGFPMKVAGTAKAPKF